MSNFFFNNKFNRSEKNGCWKSYENMSKEDKK